MYYYYNDYNLYVGIPKLIYIFYEVHYHVGKLGRVINYIIISGWQFNTIFFLRYLLKNILEGCLDTQNDSNIYLIHFFLNNLSADL